jgi:predicted house-cleaning noncanonical NTP pyrophosphatase (MazG superfamily)
MIVSISDKIVGYLATSGRIATFAESSDRETLLKLLNRLLESNDNTSNESSKNRPIDYLDLWQSELELKGPSKLTITSYRQKVEALLEVNPTPDKLAIKEYLAKKQQSGNHS